MRDLSVKEPWKGPGRDPRAESWANTEPEDNEDEDDSGEEIDRSKLFYLLAVRCSSVC
jgi:hypothetical protein